MTVIAFEVFAGGIEGGDIGGQLALGLALLITGETRIPYRHFYALSANPGGVQETRVDGCQPLAGDQVGSGVCRSLDA